MNRKESMVRLVNYIKEYNTLGFTGGSVLKNSPANAGEAGVRKIPWRRK